jgi:hypothetical protein
VLVKVKRYRVGEVERFVDCYICPLELEERGLTLDSPRHTWMTGTEGKKGCPAIRT